jgi:hypothetical protein
LSALEGSAELEFTAWSGIAALDQGKWLDVKLEMTRAAATALFNAVQGDHDASDRDILDTLGEAMHLIDVNFNDHFYHAKQKALTPLMPKAILKQDLPPLPEPSDWRVLAFSMRDFVIRVSLAHSAAPVINKRPNEVEVQDLLVEALKPPSAKGRSLIKEGALLDESAVKKITSLARSETPGWTIAVIRPSPLCRMLFAPRED